MTTTNIDWPTKTLAELGGRVTSGSRGWASFYAESGSLFVRITNLNRHDIYLDLTNPRFVQVDPQNAEVLRTRLAQGDLLISITADIGIVGYVDEHVPSPAYINQHIARVRLDPRLADSRFVAYYLSSWEPQRRFVGATDTGAKAGMNLAAVVALTTAVPPLAEQAAIAKALADADELIATLQGQITKKQAIKQGLMQQLLTARTRLPGFGSPWGVRKVGEFATVRAGGTPSTSVAAYWGGDIPWMSSGEIHQKQVMSVRGRITLLGLQKSSAQLMPPGTVLMALAGQGKTRGTVAVSRIQLTTNQSIAGIYPGGEHDSDYLYYNLDARYTKLRGESAGDGGRGGLNLTIIKNLLIPFPDRTEQQAIASVLLDADAEIDALQRRLEKVRYIKTGIMQQLLTGRTRLPMEAAS